MKAMPHSDKTLLIRTDFSNDKVWEDVRSLASKPGPDFQEHLNALTGHSGVLLQEKEKT